MTDLETMDVCIPEMDGRRFLLAHDLIHMQLNKAMADASPGPRSRKPRKPPTIRRAITEIEAAGKIAGQLHVNPDGSFTITIAGKDGEENADDTPENILKLVK
jgi:hypothetical protein